MKQKVRTLEHNTMTPLIEKYMNVERIREIIIREKYDNISKDEFIRFLDLVVRDAEKDNDFRKGYEEEFLDFLQGYMDSFVAEREKGFSVAWSRSIAYSVLEMNNHAIACAYLEAFNLNQEQAQEDLLLYAKIKKLDVFFTKHFVFLLTVDSPFQEPTVEKQAIDYSEIFQEQISKGKSEIFADKYADLKACGKYSELGCYAEAAEYEKALSAGFSESEANCYADKISEYIANYCSSYEESLTNPFANQERLKLEKEFKPLLS